MIYQIEAASINDNLHTKSEIEIHNMSNQIEVASINDNLHSKSEIEIQII